MKAILAVLLFYYFINCSTPPTVPPPVEGCQKFKIPEDCVLAKEINTTLAYYLGSNNDTLTISVSKLDSSQLPITKIKNSDQLTLYKTKIKSDDPKVSPRKYFETTDKKKEPDVQDLVQFIQDEQEGIIKGLSPVQVRDQRIALQKEQDEKRKRELDEMEIQKRERILKEIAAFPYTIELICISNLTDDKLEMSECATKLKPTMKITIPSENKLYANFTKSDFLNGTLSNANVKLPKDFNVSIISEGLDSSTLFQVVLVERTPSWESPKKREICTRSKI